MSENMAFSKLKWELPRPKRGNPYQPFGNGDGNPNEIPTQALVRNGLCSFGDLNGGSWMIHHMVYIYLYVEIEQ